ncbi:unnamed protein product [Thelazia callipaeda]|uniref:SAM-dependent MTase TRM10-type domain-containing protein n=1 Tax=Thelazia callipaeda TaxID=103827 RepID=A0A158RC72_THECL|nr:unnamed protein product [Thelazia callipaeda]
MECFSELLHALEDDEERAVVQRNNLSYFQNKCIKEQHMRLLDKRRLNRRNEHRRRRINQARKEIVNYALSFELQILIDFGFSQYMSNKEMSGLVRQMGRVWGIQKKTRGLKIILSAPDTRFLSEGSKKLSGFDRFSWVISNKNLEMVINEHRFVYLSPDPQLDPLLEVKPEIVYIVGGLVDESGVGSLSRRRAEELNVDVRRLPIQEFLIKRNTGTFNIMLAINQVVEILVRYVCSKDWVQALSVVPKRIGYGIPEFLLNFKTKGLVFVDIKMLVHMPVTEIMQGYNDDDFFGVHAATETQLPRQMEAAKTLRSRIKERERRRPCNEEGCSTSNRRSTDYDTITNYSAEDLDRTCVHSNSDCDNKVVESNAHYNTGLWRIWEKIDSVWEMSDEQLVDVMVNRIIYEDGELIAFDKPYQVAFCNAPRNQAEILRILPQLSSHVSPRGSILHIVKSISKPATGIILFAKNRSAQERMKALYNNGFVKQYYRILTNMKPKHDEAVIHIPLIKCKRDNNYVMLPLGATQSNKISPFLEAKTQYRLLKHDSRNQTSYMECIIKQDAPDQIRAHFGLGIACPIIGDFKYNWSRREAGKGIPPRLLNAALQDLHITGSSFRRLPMFMHLKEVVISISDRRCRKIHITAPLPSFFTYTLSKLRLLK